MPLQKPKLLPFDDNEAQKVIRASRSDKSRRLLISKAVQERITRAIVLIHNDARYFEGMAILAGMAGFKPRVLENEFDDFEEQLLTRKKFNEWVKKMRGF